MVKCLTFKKIATLQHLLGRGTVGLGLGLGLGLTWVWSKKLASFWGTSEQALEDRNVLKSGYLPGVFSTYNNGYNRIKRW